MGKMHTHQCVHKGGDGIQNLEMHCRTSLLLPKLLGFSFFFFSLFPGQPLLSELYPIFLTQMERKTWNEKPSMAFGVAKPNQSDGLEAREFGF